MRSEKPGVPRRLFLKGVGGVVLGLPLLESFAPRDAKAQAAPEPFAVFFRQACGVACEQDAELGPETEKFWPTELGALTTDTVSGRAVDELGAHLTRLLVIRGVAMDGYDYGDGHANGALQGLTARGPVVDGVGGDSEAAGESIDHRIGRELNPDGRDSLFLHAGARGGWLGGPCISYRGSNNRRAATRNPYDAYQLIIGGAGLPPDEALALQKRQKSVNDLVRAQTRDILTSPVISANDRRRIEQHLAAVRDVEIALGCRLEVDAERALETDSSGYDEGSDGHVVLAMARLHMDVAALAIACGYTRSVAIQVGNGNDGDTKYPDKDGNLMNDNYHYISHRRQSHDSSGTIIQGSDMLHHTIDRHFGKTFAHLVDRLAAYDTPTGGKLIDYGMAVWYNDNGNGPGHARVDTPVIIAGGAGGYLKQGQYIDAGGGWDKTTHNKVLNTIGAAAGLKNGAGAPLDDFGDPKFEKGQIDAMKE
jgi:hypothetical protein